MHHSLHFEVSMQCVEGSERGLGCKLSEGLSG